MKTTLITAIVILASLGSTTAQKETGYKKIFYKNSTVETNDVTFVIDDAVSTAGETKFKLKIVNKTSDYILFKAEESKFIIDGKETNPTEKPKTIKPNDSGWLVVNLKGAGYNNVKNYTFEVVGLYKISANGKAVEVPDFKLPAAANDFKAGSFDCELDKVIKETEKTEVKFLCTYNGDKVGFITPSKMSVKMPDGNEYATVKSKSSVVLSKGQSATIAGYWDRMSGGKDMDMQKATMFVKFNGTFTEVTPEKFPSQTLKLEFDEATSNDKGK